MKKQQKKLGKLLKLDFNIKGDYIMKVNKKLLFSKMVFFVLLFLVSSLPVTAKDKIDGFKDQKWGTSIKYINPTIELDCFEYEGDMKYCYSNIKTFGPVNIDKCCFLFKNGDLCLINIQINDSGNWSAFIGALTLMYGKPNFQDKLYNNEDTFLFWEDDYGFLSLPANFDSIYNSSSAIFSSKEFKGEIRSNVLEQILEVGKELINKNKLDGFKGQKWGTDIKDIDTTIKLTFYEEKEGMNENDKLISYSSNISNIGTIKLDACHFVFLNDKFYTLRIILSDINSRLIFFEALKKKYGEADTSKVPGEKEITASWADQFGQVIYSVDTINFAPRHITTILFFSNEAVKDIKSRYEEETKKAVDGF